MEFCSDDQNFEIYLEHLLYQKKADTVEALVSDHLDRQTLGLQIKG